MARNWVRALPIVVAVAVIGAGAALGFGRAEPPVVPETVTLSAGAPKGASVVGTWKAGPPPTPTSFAVADATVGLVHLFAQPGSIGLGAVAGKPAVPLAARPTMDNPTWEHLPVVFLVLQDKGAWLHVRVSSRPNNLTAWVARSEVRLRTVPNHVVVQVGARRITVYHGDTVLLQDTVAVGTDRTPTPLGNFFVDGAVHVPYDTGPYGPFQVSVSGFSNVLSSFGGGIGQIALHGTNHPQLLGQAVSNGCIRMANTTITKVVQLAPLGTPVDVVA